MKPQKKIASSLALFFAAPMAFAGPPVQYDQWSVDGGTIDTTSSCSATGVSCETLVSSNGMLYEQVTTPEWSYLRMIVTETDATGDAADLAFADETYVPFSLYDANGNSTTWPDNNKFPQSVFQAVPQGISSKQVVRDAADNFENTTEIQRANARQFENGDWITATPEEMFTVKIDQTFSTAEIDSSFSYKNYTQFATGAEFTDPDTGVTYLVAEPDTDYKIGASTDISQTMDVSDATRPNATQMMVYRSREGYMGNTTPAKAWPGSAPYLRYEPMVSQGGVNLDGNTPINWGAGDKINTTWIVESNGSTTGGFGSAISYQQVNADVKQTDGTVNSLQDTAIIFDTPTSGTAQPFDWDPNFGAEPSL